MRVHDGMYAVTSGLRFSAPAQVYETAVSDSRVSIIALIPGEANAPKINGRVLRIALSCPHEGMMRVTVSHGPADPDGSGFLLPGHTDLPLSAEETDDHFTVSGGGLSVAFDRTGWRYRFSGPAGFLVESGRESLGIVECADGSAHIAEKLSLRPGECIYGLGERFGPLVRNGQSIRMWNADAGTSSDLAYKNIPFYLSSEGYGVLVNTSAAAEFEVATEDNSAVGITVPGRILDYLVIAGRTPAEVLSRLGAVTGRPPVIPRWSLGLWLSTSFTTSYDEKTIMEHVEGMAGRDIPLSVFHFDCFWMRERHWCDFTWNTDAFPDPPGMLARLKARGLHVCLWINPYISELSRLYEEGASRGFFLTRTTGEVYRMDWWQPGIAFVDFSNPAACAWYQSKLRALLEMGADTFKTDFGESAPADAVYHDGSPGEVMHNRYALLFNRTVFDLLEAVRGEGDAVVFARSASIGSQQYPVHWGGDSTASYSSMASQLRGGLSFMLSGPAFWSHDIGGFYGKPTPDLYKRWVAFGLLSSHSRLHGNSSYRVPWNFDEESVAVLRHFTHLRRSLLPYLCRQVAEAHEDGMPLMRPMVLAFPDDPTCRFIDCQYMLGEDLLVAPILNAEGVARYYLPAGQWSDYATGAAVTGGGWRTATCDYFTVPLLAKGNAMIPTLHDTTAEDPCPESLVLRIYGLEGRSNTVVECRNRFYDISAERSVAAIVLSMSEALPGLRVAFMGERIASVAGDGERCEPIDGAPAVRLRGTRCVVSVGGQYPLTTGQ